VVTVTAENYVEYPLLILSRSEKKEIAWITADTNGNYRVAAHKGSFIRWRFLEQSLVFFWGAGAENESDFFKKKTMRLTFLD
jgi:hypothetical protein